MYSAKELSEKQLVDRRWEWDLRIARSTRVIPTGIEYVENGAIMENNSADDTQMPHVMARSPDIEFTGRAALWEMEGVEEQTDDICQNGQSEWRDKGLCLGIPVYVEQVDDWGDHCRVEG